MLKTRIKLKGYTFIELIIVMIIFLIIITVFVSKYANVSTETNTLTTRSIAEALNSANTANVFLRSINPARGFSISNCTDAKNLLQQGIPIDMTINPSVISVDTSVQCTVLGPSGSDASATFIANGIN